MMIHRLAVLLSGAIALSALLLPATTAGAQTTEDNKCWDYRITERAFARKMNASRTEAGLDKLSLDPELSKVARVHTNEMIRRGELYHTPSERLGRRVTNWIVLGENIGVGSSVRSLYRQFMNSEAHRDNIMNVGFKHVGVGVRLKGLRLWVTIVYEGILDPGTTLRMPEC